jgi:hypothetical protein
VCDFHDGFQKLTYRPNISGDAMSHCRSQTFEAAMFPAEVVMAKEQTQCRVVVAPALREAVGNRPMRLQKFRIDPFIRSACEVLTCRI